MQGRDVQSFWCVNLRERDHWVEPDIDGRINIMMDGRQR
jgi:hypothetical protein